MLTWCDAAHASDETLRALYDRQDPYGGTLLVVATPKMDTPRKLLAELLARLGKDVTTGTSASRVDEVWATATAWLTAWEIDDLVVCGAHRLPGRLIGELATRSADLAARVTLVTDGPLDLAQRAALGAAAPSTVDALVARLAPGPHPGVALVVHPLALDTDASDTYRRYATLASHATASRPAPDDVWFAPLDTPVAGDLERALERSLGDLDATVIPAAVDGIETGIALHGYRWPDRPGRVGDLLAAKCTPLERLARFREPTAGAALALAHLELSPATAHALARDDVDARGRSVGTDPPRLVGGGHLRRALAAQLARYPGPATGQFLGLHGRTATRAEIVLMVRRGVRQVGGHLAG